MPRATVGPLTEDDYTEVNRLLKMCATARKEVETAIAAKQPLDGNLALILELCDELTAIKKAFWPDRP